jgi:nucleotide-binding universal stress UspA family protein
MSGRREFLLGNVPNRVSHNSRWTVVIVNTAEETKSKLPWRRK